LCPAAPADAGHHGEFLTAEACYASTTARAFKNAPSALPVPTA
jgi:hypothetical protein